MRNLTRRCSKSVAVMATCITVALFFHAGCGGSGSSENSSDNSLSVTRTVADLIRSDSYAGHLVVHLDETIGARLDETSEVKSLYSRNADTRIDSVQQTIERYPNVVLKRSVTAPPEKVDEHRMRLEGLSGKKLADLNSVYYLETYDAAEAIEILSELRGTEGVNMVYPALRPAMASLEAVPLLTELQGYLYKEADHGGLNALAAWDKGVRGDDVYLAFHEGGINFNHEDLGLVAEPFRDGGNYWIQPDCAPGFPQSIEGDCEKEIAHGTATAGIAIGVDNDQGITGFAPSAHFIHIPLSGGAADYLIIGTDGIDTASISDDDMEPGTIWVLPRAVKIAHPDCVGGQGSEGCVPIDIVPFNYSAIQYAVEYGITVIIGAGNYAFNLDDPSIYGSDEPYIDLSDPDNDSGAIVVGASYGSNEIKLDESTCGSRVDLFAWGDGVVTTGYSYSGYEWLGDSNLVPPNQNNDTYFVNNFRGTSAATAMVGGAAALVQSYVKSSLGKKTYLMPLKMREVLVNSDVPQADDGCNIGTQPRLDVAMELVDQFLNGLLPQFSEIENDEVMSFDRMKQLRDAGIGLICKKYDPTNSDPSCPHSEIYPPGGAAAPSFDFDGDGRADLVQWTNGTWKLDLSGQGSMSSDNYGAWDIEITHAPIGGEWVWPYVEDMNSDGFSDFVVYDKEHGTWYIKYMTIDFLIKGGLNGKPWVWDEVVDYPNEDVYQYRSHDKLRYYKENIEGDLDDIGWVDDPNKIDNQWLDDRKLDPKESRYSRPYVADANMDGWLDITIACSDGFWRIDFGGPENNGFGEYEKKVKYLTDSQLVQAPGWAYLTSVFGFSPYQGTPLDVPEKTLYIVTKVPDGLPGEGRVFIFGPEDFNEELVETEPSAFGGNDRVLVPGRFVQEPADNPWGVPAIKDSQGNWEMGTFASEFVQTVLAQPGPVYGGSECHPVVADFDGDGLSDKTVMCPDEWRIMYSDEASFIDDRDASGIRHIGLGYDESEISLPGRSYAGGVSYSYAQEIIESHQILYPNTPPPIPVDAISLSVK